MKFETQNGVKIALYLPLRQKRIFRLPLQNKIFGAATRIRPDIMSGMIRKLIGPAKT